MFKTVCLNICEWFFRDLSSVKCWLPEKPRDLSFYGFADVTFLLTAQLDRNAHYLTVYVYCRYINCNHSDKILEILCGWLIAEMGNSYLIRVLKNYTIQKHSSRHNVGCRIMKQTNSPFCIVWQAPYQNLSFNTQKDSIWIQPNINTHRNSIIS